MGSNPIALTNEISTLAQKHQTKHLAEINQGNTWGNATAPWRQIGRARTRTGARPADKCAHS
jgi:hypothetical protein